MLAGTFLFFWMVLRSRLYLLPLSAAYLLSAFGFVFQRYDLHVGFYASKMISVGSFAAATILITAAVCLRYGRPIPYAALAILIGSGLGAFTWFMLGDPSLTWRIYSMNFALGGVSALVMFELRAVPHKTSINRLLYTCAALTTVNFFARTIAVVYMHGAYDTYDGFYTSIYWTSLLLSHAMLSLAIALSLIVAASLDVFAELKTESLTDPLSGLLNRRGVMEKACGSKRRPGMDEPAYSLVIADIDHFKIVNDKHGHLTGDMVIRALAGMLQSAGGKRAIVGRIGGEEFVVLFPDQDLAATQFFAENLRQKLQSGPLQGSAAIAGTITCSFGVAQRSGNETLENTFRRADEALMQAKRGGRNRVRTAYARPEEAVRPSRRKPCDAGLSRVV